jgi:hypothetical protein
MQEVDISGSNSLLHRLLLLLPHSPFPRSNEQYLFILMQIVLGLLNIGLSNAHKIYQLCAAKKITFVEFCIQAVQEILGHIYTVTQSLFLGGAAAAASSRSGSISPSRYGPGRRGTPSPTSSPVRHTRSLSPQPNRVCSKTFERNILRMSSASDHIPTKVTNKSKSCIVCRSHRPSVMCSRCEQIVCLGDCWKKLHNNYTFH